MKYYTSTTEFNCGIDLHARQMYVCVMDRQGNKLVQSQRDCALQPKVARLGGMGGTELAWENGGKHDQPQRGCGQLPQGGGENEAGTHPCAAGLARARAATDTSPFIRTAVSVLWESDGVDRDAGAGADGISCWLRVAS